MMWGYGWQTGPWMGWWMLIPLIFGLALLGVAIWAIARLTAPRATITNPRTLAENTAEEILRRRYASGEIDAQTYETMRERLEGGPPRQVAAPRV